MKKAVKNIKREKQILPGRGSQAYTILNLIAASGELPANQIKRLSGGNRYKEQVVKKLKSKQLIHTYESSIINKSKYHFAFRFILS